MTREKELLTEEEKLVLDNLFKSENCGMEVISVQDSLPPRHSYTEQLLDQIRDWVMVYPYVEFEKAISKRVVGQPGLRDALVPVYSYLMAIAENRKPDHNMIISAPSGCGKTETYRALKDFFAETIPSLPVYIFDLSQVTLTGYKGKDASEIVEEFRKRKIKQAIGLVFLDEFDKKMKPCYDSNGTDMNRETQANLLTLIEGSKVGIVDTNYTMFIGLGSFSSLRESDTHVKNPIGLGNDMEWKQVAENRYHYKKLTRDDLIRAGGSHELIGRFSYIVNYQPLSAENMRPVIEKIKKDVMNSMSIESLELSDAAIDVLTKSVNSEYGCRLIASDIRNMIMNAYQEAIVDAPDWKTTLNMKVDDDLQISYEWNLIKEMEVF
jgi:ATP-dependent protease Clp ATPase subunit